MRVRSLLLDNLSWKLLSLTLALLIWSGTRLFMRQDIRPLGHPLAPIGARDFRDLPVRILADGDLGVPVRIDPPTVLLRVSGDISLLERLTEKDTLAFVEVPNTIATNGPLSSRVEIRLPPAVRIFSVDPKSVVITPLPKP